MCNAPFVLEMAEGMCIEFKTQLQTDLEEMLTESDRSGLWRDPEPLTDTDSTPLLTVLAETADTVAKADERGDPPPSPIKTRSSNPAAPSRPSYADFEEDGVENEPELFKPRAAFFKRSETASFVLRDWFERHVTWPYPDAAQVDLLIRRTGLNKKQIRHFFINWRKRHWAELFDRVVPLNERAVEVYLERKFGSLQKGVDKLLRM